MTTGSEQETLVSQGVFSSLNRPEAMRSKSRGELQLTGKASPRSHVASVKGLGDRVQQRVTA